MQNLSDKCHYVGLGFGLIKCYCKYNLHSLKVSRVQFHKAKTHSRTHALAPELLLWAFSPKSTTVEARKLIVQSDALSSGSWWSWRPRLRTQPRVISAESIQPFCIQPFNTFFLLFYSCCHFLSRWLPDKDMVKEVCSTWSSISLWSISSPHSLCDSHFAVCARWAPKQ